MLTFSYEREEDRMKLAQRVDQCFPMVNGDEKTECAKHRSGSGERESIHRSTAHRE
jgi:hypothetical protein